MQTSIALLAAFACSSLFGSLEAEAAANALTTENRKAVQEIVEKVKQTKESLLEAESQKRRVLGSLYVINQRMKKISSEKNHLTDELFQVQDNVKNIAKIIAALEMEIDKQRKLLKRRLRALYKLSGEGYVNILMTRNNSMELDESLRFLKIVTENDYRLIQNYQENIALYTNQKIKLKGQIGRLVTIEKKIKKQEGLLAEEHRTKSKIVSELDSKRTANLDRIKSLRSRSGSIEDYDELLKPSIFERKGQLPSPIVGTIIQDFGLITDEKYKIRLSHKGWLYQGTDSAAVTSVFDGAVAYIGTVNGYGETVIIDHGDHYYTVYGHLSRIKVKVSESVKQGQLLAESGPIERTRTTGLYFEIRHFSEPENPVNWIAAKGVQISPLIPPSPSNEVGEVAKAAYSE